MFAAAQQFAHEAQEPFDTRYLVRAAFAALAGHDTGSEGDTALTTAAPAEKTPTAPSSLGELTRHLFSEHRHTLDRIVEALGERNRLLKHELLDLIHDAGT